MNQKGSTLLEVLVAIALFSIAFLVINRTIAVSLQLASDSDLVSRISTESENLLVSQFEKESDFVELARTMRKVGEKRSIVVGGGKTPGQLERNLTVERISDSLWKIRVEVSALDNKRKRRNHVSQTVVSFP